MSWHVVDVPSRRGSRNISVYFRLFLVSCGIFTEKHLFYPTDPALKWLSEQHVASIITHIHPLNCMYLGGGSLSSNYFNKYLSFCLTRFKYHRYGIFWKYSIARNIEFKFFGILVPSGSSSMHETRPRSN